MVTRVRLIYEKRGGACFVPHVALATLFARAARRAGIILSSTDGFSPHAKMSFGPELPAGIVALNEPVDMWLKEDVAKGMENVKALEWLTLLDEQMPEGFHVKGCTLLPDASRSLGKDCKVAHYWIWTRNGKSMNELLLHLKNYFEEDVLSAELLNVNEEKNDEEKNDEEKNLDPWISVVLENPAKNGIGGWVKALAAANLAGWPDLCIVRTTVFWR